MRILVGEKKVFVAVQLYLKKKWVKMESNFPSDYTFILPVLFLTSIY